MRQSFSNTSNRQYDDRYLNFFSPLVKFDYPSILFPASPKGDKQNWYPCKVMCDMHNDIEFIQFMMSHAQNQDGSKMFTKKQIADNAGDIGVQLNMNMNKKLDNGSSIFSLAYVLYPRVGGVFDNETEADNESKADSKAKAIDSAGF